MTTLNDRLRPVALTLVSLGAVLSALAFTFTLNNGDGTSQHPGTGMPVKWPAGSIRLKLMLGDTANLSDGFSFNQSARSAALAWNTVLGAAQFQTETATDSPGDNNDLNELGFSATIYGRSFDSNTLAVTTGYSLGNERIEADIIFNTAYTWDSYRGSLHNTGGTLTPDFQRVALHELGHVLGLNHPDEAGQSVDAIMNSRVSNRYELSSDDTEGAQSLYGPPGVPANDNFANATVLSLGGNQTLSVKGYNTNATKESGDPRQGDNPGGRSVWWRWAAPSAGSVTLDTKGSYFDTTLGVYTGTSLAGLVKIVDNDDTKTPTDSDPTHVQASTVTFTATAGTEYRIDVDGFNNIEQNSADLNGADNAGITLNLAFSGSLGTAPSITTQPAGQSVNTGGSVSFSVVASGTTPLSYQWYFNNGAISGATSSTYSLSSVTTAQAGSYHVVVSNQAGSATSNTAALTVNTPAPTPAPSSGGGGGGGAPSLWFVAALAALGLARACARRPTGKR